MWPGSAADGSRARLLDLGAPFSDRLDDAVRACRPGSPGATLAPETSRARVLMLPLAADPGRLPAGPLDEAATKALLAPMVCR